MSPSLTINTSTEGIAPTLEPTTPTPETLALPSSPDSFTTADPTTPTLPLASLPSLPDSPPGSRTMLASSPPASPSTPHRETSSQSSHSRTRSNSSGTSNSHTGIPILSVAPSTPPSPRRTMTEPLAGTADFAGPLSIQTGATLTDRPVLEHRHSMVKTSSPLRQEVASNIKQPRRVSSVMGFGGLFGSPDSPEKDSREGTDFGPDMGSVGGSSQGHGRRRSIMGMTWSTSALRRGSDDSGDKTSGVQSSASAMLATLPPRISSKRSTPNLSRPSFPAHPPPPVPANPTHNHMGGHMVHPGPMGPMSHMNSMNSMNNMRGSVQLSPNPNIPHMQARRQTSLAPWNLPPPAMMTTAPRSAPKPKEEKRVSTLNLPPMGFTNREAPKFSRAAMRRSGIVMPSAVPRGYRPPSHYPSVTSLNTVDERAGGSLQALRNQRSTGIMASIDRRGSQASLASVDSFSSDASGRQGRGRTSPQEEADTLETLLESSAHSRQASVDLPVPNAAFMRRGRERKDSNSSIDSLDSARSALSEQSEESEPSESGRSVRANSVESEVSDSAGSAGSMTTGSSSSLGHSPGMPVTPRLEDAPSGNDESSTTVNEAADEARFMQSLNGRFRPDLSMGGTSRTGSKLFVAAPAARLPHHAAASKARSMSRGPDQIRVRTSDESELPYAQSQSQYSLNQRMLSGSSSSVARLAEVHPQYRVALPQQEATGWRGKKGGNRVNEVSGGDGQMGEKALKTKKSAVLLNKLSRAFGMKRKEKEEVRA